MGLVEFITKLFGNKAQKDMREIMPYVDQIKAVYDEIDRLSNDSLRARSAALMQRIQERVADKKARIACGSGCRRAGRRVRRRGRSCRCS